MRHFLFLLITLLITASCSDENSMIAKEEICYEQVALQANFTYSTPYPPVGANSETGLQIKEFYIQREIPEQFPATHLDKMKLEIDVSDFPEGMLRTYEVLLNVANTDVVIKKRIESTSNSLVIYLSNEDITGSIPVFDLSMLTFGKVRMTAAASDTGCGSVLINTDVLRSGDDADWCQETPVIKINTHYSDDVVSLHYTVENYPDHYPINVRHDLKMLNSNQKISVPSFQMFGSTVRHYQVSDITDNTETTFHEKKLYGTVEADIATVHDNFGKKTLEKCQGLSPKEYRSQTVIE